ncbi:MAG: hypothetical protein NDF57_05570 [archaeon GBS-70-058]|nr:hypothetical protein [Candidatus Culexarchaeum nevadense]
MMLPKAFIDWAYFGRVKVLKSQLSKGFVQEPMFFIDMMRHTPILATASIINGRIFVNAKVVGAGFILKEDYIDEALGKLREHYLRGESMDRLEYAKEGVKLLLEILYFDDEVKAYEKVDFTKIATLELAAGRKDSSKHTWTNIQSNREACLLYYMPPNISFEIHGEVDVHLEGKYYEFVNLVHDAFHYTPPKARVNRPCLIFNVREVYDNSPRAMGIKIS